MQFAKVDDDAYTVVMNLDTIRRISVEMSYIDEHARFDGVDQRKRAIGQGFKTAYNNFSQPEVSVDESTE